MGTSQVQVLLFYSDKTNISRIQLSVNYFKNANNCLSISNIIQSHVLSTNVQYLKFPRRPSYNLQQ